MQCRGIRLVYQPSLALKAVQKLCKPLSIVSARCPLQYNVGWMLAFWTDYKRDL